MTYWVSTGTLTAQISNTCGGSQPGTGETSNVVYGGFRRRLPAREIFQLFVG